MKLSLHKIVNLQNEYINTQNRFINIIFHKIKKNFEKRICKLEYLQKKSICLEYNFIIKKKFELCIKCFKEYLHYNYTLQLHILQNQKTNLSF